LHLGETVMAAQPFTLAFGALAPPIREQLKERGVSVPGVEAARWQACARALTVVRLHGLVPPEVSHRGERRLCERILKWLVEHKKLVKVPRA
jgi:hypothetical protein